MAKLSCLICQIDIPETLSAAARDEHLCRVVSLVDQKLSQQRVELVVLPELSSIDYSRGAFEQLHVLGESAQGPSFEVWSELAKKHEVFVVYGFPLITESGYTIATGIVNSQGKQVAIYHKLHLAQFGDSMEKEYFSPGSPVLAIFQLNGFTLAPIICYDIRAPELCRTLALEHNVDLILHTGAYARDPSFYSWHAFATTRAVENQLYFVSLNRAGIHYGQSIVCPPWVDENHLPVVLDEQMEELRVVTFDRRVLSQARTDYTFIEDRLSDYNLPVVG